MVSSYADKKLGGLEDRLKTLDRLGERAGEYANVPAPLGVDQARLSKDPQVMRDRRLRQLEPSVRSHTQHFSPAASRLTIARTRVHAKRLEHRGEVVRRMRLQRFNVRPAAKEFEVPARFSLDDRQSSTYSA